MDTNSGSDIGTELVHLPDIGTELVHLPDIDDEFRDFLVTRDVDEFEDFLKEYLGLDFELLIEHHLYAQPGSTILMTMSVNMLSSNSLLLLDQFLSELSSEKISEYVNRTDIDGNCVMTVCRNVDLLGRIIGYVQDVNVRNKWGNNALINAAAALNIKLIHLLLEHKIDVNATNAHSESAAMYCCTGIEFNNEKRTECALKLLIDAGLNILTRSIDGRMASDYIRDKAGLSAKMLRLLQIL